MLTTPQNDDLRQRVTELERRLTETAGDAGRHVSALEDRVRRLERSGGQAHPGPAAPTVQLAIAPDERGTSSRGRDRVIATTVRRLGSASLDDLIGGRLLAWVGGASILVGLVLFLAIAIAHGWIGVQARVVMAGAAGAALILGGVWLHDHRGRTEASAALVGAGTAGLFATLVVAGEVYGLIAPLVAIAGCLAVGTCAATLAVRWAGRVIGALGMLGALLSPVLVGAPIDLAAVSLLAVAMALTMATAVVQRWRWLGIAATLICAPQWTSWILRDQPTWMQLLVLTWFGAAGLAGALCDRSDLESDRTSAASATLIVLTTTIVAGIGRIALGRAAGDAWLFGLAATDVALGVVPLPRLRSTGPTRRLLTALGVVLADVALGLTVSGVALVIGWGVAAVAFAALSRTRHARGSDATLVETAVLTHVGLTLIRSVIAWGSAGADPGSVDAIVSVAVLATACLASAQLIESRETVVGRALTLLGLAAIAGLSAQSVSGPGLAIAWALEALALGALHRRTGDQTAGYGAVCFSALAAGHLTLIEAPPSALIDGVSTLPGTLLAAVAVATTAAQHGWRHPDIRLRLVAFGSAGLTLLYGASVGLVSAFQPGAGPGAGLLDLGVRQEGQVLLSAMWTAIGLVALIAGLRRNSAAIRHVALGLLLLAVAKVFLYDLSSLTSLYRVTSTIALGLLLLAGAFAYQRLRPPPPPDIRRVHRSQR